METKEISKLVGQLLTIGFEGKEPNKDVEDFIRDNNIGGVIYFGHNIENPEQLANLTNHLQSLNNKPLFISTDQEGGKISYLKPPFIQFPSAKKLGKEATPKIIFDYMQVMAAELKAVGINWNLAPVCDIDTNPENPIISKLERSFSSNAEEVEKIVSGALRGLQKGGIISCAKHFPGHGDTKNDSHLTLPVLDLTIDRLRDLELRPFKRAIKSGVETVMTAHILYTAIDDSYPATISKKILQGLLREECRFNGVIVSDDMNMKGITEHYPSDQALTLAINSGVDHLLYCKDFETQQLAHENLLKAVTNKEISLSRIEEAVSKIDDLKLRYIGKNFVPVDPKKAKEIVGCEEHHKIVTIK